MILHVDVEKDEAGCWIASFIGYNAYTNGATLKKCIRNSYNLLDAIIEQGGIEKNNNDLYFNIKRKDIK